MSKLYCIGEMLIDFIPSSHYQFERHFGGAPANVALAVARLGGQSQFIGQVGNDAFGEFLKATLDSGNVDTSTVKISKTLNTPLAFVTLTSDGERSFSFYRDNTADLGYHQSNIETIKFKSYSILHFCSVSLVPSNVKDAHEKAIKAIKENKGLISFDPNLRFNLWPSESLLKETVWAFLPYVDLLKVSEEELEFLTDETVEEKGIKKLSALGLNAILVSRGKKGSALYTNRGYVEHGGYCVKAIDTTGSGDAFISAVLKKILTLGIDLDTYTMKQWVDILEYANAAGALTATQKGATNAIPNHETILNFQSNKNVPSE